MNAYLFANVSNAWLLAGWTMVHFLWLGALVALLALVLRRVLRRTAASVRYAVALASLAALAALPILIAAGLAQFSPVNHEVAEGIVRPIELAPNVGQVVEKDQFLAEIPDLPKKTARQSELRKPDVPTMPLSNGEYAAGPNPTAVEILSAALKSCVRYLPWLWLIGTPLTFALTATGFVGTRRLRLASPPIMEGPITELLAKLAASLRLGKRVTVAVCDRIAAPVLIGILRPIILLPPAALTGYTPDEIEMVLLHELAHVRRWDNLVNLLQRLVESLLFFHPAVWLVSSWVRREREACCDAVVVARTQHPHAYAELLVALAAQMPRSVLFHPAASSAMAAGPLRSRIRRILQLDDDPMLISGKSFTLMLAAVVTVAMLAVFYLPTIGQAEQSTNDAAKSTEKTDEKKQSDSARSRIIERASPQLAFALKRAESGQAQLYLNEKPIDEQGVRAAIPREEKQARNLLVTLNADRGIKHSDVMKIVDLLESLGVRKLSLDTRHVEPTVKDPPATKGPSGSSGAAAEEHVFATLPAETEGPKFFEEYSKAMAEAEKKNLRLEQAFRDGKYLLLATPQPTEKDWPAILGEPPRKDRVIADRAWGRLGLKLVPLTPLEWSYRKESANARLGLRIVGGNLPNGLPVWSVLTKVDGNDLENMDNLLVWLESERGQMGKPVRCYAVSGDKEFLFESQPPIFPSANPVGSSFEPARPAPTRRQFPTLDDQKLADLAWKRLKLELEPIGAEDLKRVKALGYDGGVKVTATDAKPWHCTIDPGYILVGLHVWPTNNMKDVAQILSRDDLEELAPLRCYFVTEVLVPDPNDSNEVIPKDSIVKGRLPVNFPEAAFADPGRARPVDEMKQPADPFSAPKKTSTTNPRPAVAPDATRVVDPNPYQLQPTARGDLNPGPYQLLLAPPADSAPATSPNKPAPVADWIAFQSPSKDRILVAYSIPNDLANYVREFAKTSDLRSKWDETGRFILQASQERHDQFKKLMDATPKWRDPAAAKERVASPVSIRKIDGEDALEWRTVGLTFVKDARPRPGGTRVLEVVPGSPAAWMNLRPGDILTDIEGFAVNNVRELESVIKTLSEGLPFHKHEKYSASFGRFTKNGSVQEIRVDFPRQPTVPDPAAPKDDDRRRAPRIDLPATRDVR